MNFLKNYKLNNEYEAAKDGFVYPNVSFVKEDNKLYMYGEKPIDANGFEYVDLGLPSKLLWATMNIGATKPEESGLYFQWGDTVGYTKEQISTAETTLDNTESKYFGWKDYKWSIDGSSSNFSKYTGTSQPTLELEDDAAHVLMGGSWRMPTKDEFDELIANTTSGWSNDLSGITLTSKVSGYEGKSVFFPASGHVVGGSLYDEGSCGRCWSSSLYTGDVFDAWLLGFDSSGVGTGNNYRCVGVPVRGVLPK